MISVLLYQFGSEQNGMVDGSETKILQQNILRKNLVRKIKIKIKRNKKKQSPRISNIRQLKYLLGTIKIT